MNIAFQSINLPKFWGNSSSVIRDALISPARTGLWEKHSFLYLNSQPKAEWWYAGAFVLNQILMSSFAKRSMPSIPLASPKKQNASFFNWIRCRYNCNFKCVCFWLHSNMIQKFHTYSEKKFNAFSFCTRKFSNWNICFLQWKYSSIFHLEKESFATFITSSFGLICLLVSSIIQHSIIITSVNNKGCFSLDWWFCRQNYGNLRKIQLEFPQTVIPKWI